MTVLVTGGTGSFGQAFTRRMLTLGETVRVFSRDEWKQGRMRDDHPGVDNVRFLVGDVRDRDRVLRAAEGCDLVVHAAALKDVGSCEYNPFEAVKTNVLGSQNVVEACVDAGVPKAILLSTDKAVHPVNVYGATKLCAEKVWSAANAYAGGRVTFSTVRYGNVIGSRGSVVEKWSQKGRSITLTDRRATRFWLELEHAVDLVLTAREQMRGGEVFIPKVRAGRVADLIPSGATVDETGLRQGEKLHETLISDEEIPRTWDCGDHYRITTYEPEGAKRVPDYFRYDSMTALWAEHNQRIDGLHDFPPT